ncbi:MAG: CbiX/SirB N-terminal domain-containing protein [Ethanoligenens sp.]
MTGMIVLAHGSREAQAAEAWHALEQAVRLQLKPTSAGSHKAPPLIHFQFGMGGLPEALDTLAAAGADDIAILPYFLFSGYHLRHTIPELIQAWQKAHPKVRLSLDSALGEDPRMVDLLAERIGNAATDETDS